MWKVYRQTDKWMNDGQQVIKKISLEPWAKNSSWEKNIMIDLCGDEANNKQG